MLQPTHRETKKWRTFIEGMALSTVARTSISVSVRDLSRVSYMPVPSAMITLS